MKFYILTKETGSYEYALSRNYGVFSSVESSFQAISRLEKIPVDKIKIDEEYSYEGVLYTEQMFSDKIDCDDEGFYTIQEFELDKEI